MDNTKPLKDYAYLSKRMPDLKPATKVYHKKDQPDNLHLKGYANHIMYYSLLLFISLYSILNIEILLK